MSGIVSKVVCFSEGLLLGVSLYHYTKIIVTRIIWVLKKNVIIIVFNITGLLITAPIVYRCNNINSNNIVIKLLILIIKVCYKF